MQQTPQPPNRPTGPPAASRPWVDMPRIDLRQLLRMSDDTGMFQHAVFAMPDPNHGYCIDDNARALIAALLHSELRGYNERVVPIHRYLTFLAYAYNEETRRFRNFMGYDRRWLEATGSPDSQGRTIWALGLAVELAPDESIRELALNLFERTVEAIEHLEALRARAFAVLGLEAYLRYRPDDERIAGLRDGLANGLFEEYQRHAAPDWPWWEDLVTYDNGKMCHALLMAGRSMDRPDMVEAAMRSLTWLIEVQRVGGQAAQPSMEAQEEGGAGDDLEYSHLSIIGNEGWLPRGGERAAFDQQPLEAYAMVDACLAAAEATGDARVEVRGESKRWTGWAWWCFDWFLGRNDLGASLFHPETGGCQDGLLPTGVNKNQGAESVLAYLLSVLELRRYATRMAPEHAAKGRRVVPLWPGENAKDSSALELYPLAEHEPGDHAAGEHATSQPEDAQDAEASAHAGVSRGCVLICPGGGYQRVSQREWAKVAGWLNGCGYDAAVLRYPVASTHPTPLHPGPIHDATRGVRLLRHHGREWGLHTHKLAALGFSAGGHLAATLAVAPNQFIAPGDDLAASVSAAVDAVVLCYPVIDLLDPAILHRGSRNHLIGDPAFAPEPEEHAAIAAQLSPNLHITPAAPPAFLWHTVDDAKVPVENAFRYALACRRAGVPFELHAFETGQHGLALAQTNPDIAPWRILCERFLQRHLTL